MDCEIPDWRLRGQEKWLAAVELTWREYRTDPLNPNWDHDHCDFCWAKFMVEDVPDVLHAGYCTVDGYHWICKTCFEDFLDRFKWNVVQSPSDA